MSSRHSAQQFCRVIKLNKQYNIKMDPTETKWADVERINLAQGSDTWRAFVGTVLIKCGAFLE
jgi:hypothetical protein